MRIDFSLRNEDFDETQIMNKFCQYIIKKIKVDLFYSVSDSKMRVREIDLLNASWIRWKNNKPPKRINMSKLVNYIISNIVFINRRNSNFSILINPRTLMPHTYTPLEQIARFLDKGNNATPHTLLFTKVFNFYRKNLNKYWDNFISEELNKPRVTELVVIR
jgi:hypothetical protein